MSKQPEALRLAQDLDAYHMRSEHKQAAAELRRQHALIAELVEALTMMVRTHDEPADSLLQEMREQQWLEKACAAIAKATGEQQ